MRPLCCKPQNPKMPVPKLQCAPIALVFGACVTDANSLILRLPGSHLRCFQCLFLFLKLQVAAAAESLVNHYALTSCIFSHCIHFGDVHSSSQSPTQHMESTVTDTWEEKIFCYWVNFIFTVSKSQPLKIFFVFGRTRGFHIYRSSCVGLT